MVGEVGGEGLAHLSVSTIPSRRCDQFDYTSLWGALWPECVVQTGQKAAILGSSECWECPGGPNEFHISNHTPGRPHDSGPG